MEQEPILLSIEGSTPSWNASSSNSRPYRGETYIALAAAIGQKFRLIMSFMSIWKALLPSLRNGCSDDGF